MKLEKLMQMQVGLNSREMKKKKDPSFYSKEDADKDLLIAYRTNGSQISAEKETITAGDLILNITDNKTTIVSPKNEGKYLTQVNIKLITSKKIDKWYLCYLFNESEILHKQLCSVMEGTFLKRINKLNIKNLDIPFLSLDEQKRIGEFYRLFMKEIGLRQKKEKKEKKILLSLLEKNILERSKKVDVRKK